MDNYEIVGSELGRGGSGIVKEAIDCKTGQKVALKIIKNKDHDVEKEVEMMRIVSKLQNIHFVRLLKYVSAELGCGTSEHVTLVMDLAARGDFFSLVTQTGPLGERLARTYFHQLMSGLARMHEQGIAHNDLKPENLLLDHNFMLKIADFGSAERMCKDTKTIDIDGGGTPLYHSPEIYRYYDGPWDGEKSDIWSAGVILFFLCFLKPPFQPYDPDVPETKDPYFEYLLTNPASFWRAHSHWDANPLLKSESFQDMMNLIFQADPEERATLDDIRASRWYNEGVLSPEELRMTMEARFSCNSLKKTGEKDVNKRSRSTAMR
jgi:serine/threonine protein kinase